MPTEREEEARGRVLLRLNDASMGRVEVDGHDVSHLVRGVSLETWAGDEPEVTLHLCPDRVDLEVEDASILGRYLEEPSLTPESETTTGA